MRAWFALVVCLAASGCGSFEEVTTEGSLRGEAARNPLLAAQRFLERMGLSASSADQLPASYPANGVVLVSGQRFRAASPTLEHFLAWIADGGHALVFVEGFDEVLAPQAPDSGVPLALLERLGVERGPALDQDEPPGDFELSLQPSAGSLGHPGDWRRTYRLDHGAGSLSLVPEGSIIARKNLGDADHAAWLWDEVQAGARGPAQALLIHGGKDSLWSLIAKHLPAAPWALLGLVLLSLWRLAVRFGPTLPAPPPARLGFDLHVAAVGRFLWKRKEHQALVQAWRDQVLHAARTRLSLPPALGTDPTRAPGFARALAKHTQVPEDRVQRAFHTEHVDEPATFTAIVADLQAMRQAL